MKNTKERNSAITLIALIITIILLLLLSGITISQFSGNGILSKAKLAKIYSRESEAEEKVNLEIMRIQIEKEDSITLEDIYNVFLSTENQEISVNEVKKDTIDANKIKQIVVIVKGYEEFSFTIGENLNIIEICQIPRNEWKGETLENINY